MVFLALFLGLIATHSGRLYSIDGVWYYRTADGLATAGTLTFDPPVRWGPGEPVRVTAAPIGLSLALLPAVLLGMPFRDQQPVPSAAPFDMALLYEDGFYAAVSWVNPALGALAGALVVVGCRSFGVGRRLALVAGLAAVLAGPLLWYARADYPQALTTVLLLAAVLVTLHARRFDRGTEWLIPLVAAAILTRPIDGALTAMVVAGGLVVPTRGVPFDIRRALVAAAPVVTGFVAGLGFLLAVNAIRRGSPFDFGYGDSFRGFLPAGLLAYTISPGRGLAWHLPLVIVGAWGLVGLWRRRDRVALTLLGLPLLAWLLVYAQWVGLSGWAYGPRFLVPLVPLIVILAAIAVARATGPWPARLFILCVVSGAVLAASSVVVDQFYFFSIIGVNQWGTEGFWREFSLAAYAPLASWGLPGPGPVGFVPDIWWFRQAAATSGWSLVVPLILGPLAVATTIRAWRISGSPRPR